MTHVTQFPAQSYIRATSWSPDIVWLAYSDNDGTHVVNPDGSDRLTPPAGTARVCRQLSWSPDGSRLLCVDKNRSLHLLNGPGIDPPLGEVSFLPGSVDEAVWAPLTPGQVDQQLEQYGIMVSEILPAARRQILLGAIRLAASLASYKPSRLVGASPTGRWGCGQHDATAEIQGAAAVTRARISDTLVAVFRRSTPLA